MPDVDQPQTPRSRRLANLRSTVALILGVVFLGTGITKLAGMPYIVQTFHEWGYPAWFRIVIGLMETAGGVLVLIPATRILGATLISLVMVGAIGTHVLAGQWGMVPVPIVTLALALLLVSALRPRFEAFGTVGRTPR
ncbi:MAG TPA: DoxX family protein [Planctomycetota bacterium]|nr:DoxX family protein [Planctomycetota bacterium]